MRLSLSKKMICFSFLLFVCATQSFAEVEHIDLNQKGLFLKKPTKNETVILLHGMYQTRIAMWVMQRRFTLAGYPSHNFSYWSAFNTLEQIAKNLIQFIKNNVKTPTYHLTAHSLGNLVIRKAFKFGFPKGLGRIVMLAPPNNPSSAAKYWKKNHLYKMFFGRTGQQLSSESFYADIPLPKSEFGVIAGSRGWSYFGEANDSTVTVRETKLPNMKDFIVLDHEHGYIMNGMDTFQQTVRFFNSGKFIHAQDNRVQFAQLSQSEQKTSIQ